MSEHAEPAPAGEETKPRTALGKTGTFLDDRTGGAKGLKGLLGKVFPDHWSFMLGEIALYSFIVLLLSGVYLTLFFKPSQTEVIYHGSYVPLDGLPMTEAYSSTLHISFDVRGGLLMRQMHHWAALLFVAAITVHLFRVFFTGAFRKPRELNWLIGVGLLTLGLVEGFAGYSLPDDLLSGTGLRIAEGIVQAIPVVGTYLASFVFGGEFPGNDFIPRLYAIHILLVPGLILALITAHLFLVVYHKHTQYPGPGRTENNVVGYPLLPVYTAKAGGFFFVVFGVITLLAAVVTINPVWLFGPYNPSQISAGSQPDWYIGFLDGALRIMPNWESHILGHTISWNILLPAVVIPGILFTVLGAYPFIEAWVTGDRRDHHLLDRPRNMPTRTGLGAMAISFYLLLWISGGNDIIATRFDLTINEITRAMQVLVFVVPPLVYVATKRICLGLQHRDHDKLMHGWETGIIRRLPSGEFVEIHAPIEEEEQVTILQAGRTKPAALPAPPETDENGVPAPGGRMARLRSRLSRWYYSESVSTPTEEELHEAAHHAQEELENQQRQLDAIGVAPSAEDEQQLTTGH
ncbi:MAG TPA: ubiquinol-cytochrome c reductase cytochrome b subunit [Actinomycetes bacterium]|nr:ubiquinol-cytochrome c reductase cytochrome b subunit [Actinomycetes bacterium]